MNMRLNSCDKFILTKHSGRYFFAGIKNEEWWSNGRASKKEAIEKMLKNSICERVLYFENQTELANWIEGLI